VEERRRREIEPARAMLRDLLLETPRSDEDRETQARLREMHRLAERLSAMQEEVSKSLFS